MTVKVNHSDEEIQTNVGSPSNIFVTGKVYQFLDQLLTGKIRFFINDV